MLKFLFFLGLGKHLFSSFLLRLSLIYLKTSNIYTLDFISCISLVENVLFLNQIDFVVFIIKPNILSYDIFGDINIVDPNNYWSSKIICTECNDNIKGPLSRNLIKIF